MFRAKRGGVHKKLVVRDGRLIGAVLYGDARDSGWYFGLIQDGTDILSIRDDLVFGPPAGGQVAIPALVDAR